MDLLLNVPIGLILIPIAALRLRETFGPANRLDLPGLALASTGLFGIVWGVVNGNADGWTSPTVLGAIVVGALLTVAFVVWELRTETPMLPMRFFKSRAFSATNGVSLAMYFWMDRDHLRPSRPYSQFVAPFIMAGIGMSLVFPPIAAVVLGSVRQVEEGQASGANNAIRELGGFFGIAVLAAVFSAQGGYASP